MGMQRQVLLQTQGGWFPIPVTRDSLAHTGSIGFFAGSFAYLMKNVLMVTRMHLSASTIHMFSTGGNVYAHLNTGFVCCNESLVRAFGHDQGRVAKIKQLLTGGTTNDGKTSRGVVDLMNADPENFSDH